MRTPFDISRRWPASYRLLTLLTLTLLACGGDTKDKADAASMDVGVDSGVQDAQIDPDLGGGRSGPEIDVRPVMLELLAREGQTSNPTEVVIRNIGDAPLTVMVELDDMTGLFTLDESPTEVAPGEQMPIVLSYTGAADESMALLRITSNDRDEQVTTVSLIGRAPEICIEPTPGEVVMNSVDIGSQSGRFGLVLSNCGDLDIAISELRIEGDEGFNWAAVEQADPTQTPLSPHSLLRLNVWYINSALVAGELAEATLVITNDAEELRIPLSARGGDGPTCIVSIGPDPLDFSSVRLGTVASLMVEVRNDGTADCEFRELSLDVLNANPANIFTIAQGFEAEVLPAGGVSQIEVTYAPNEPNPVGDRAALRFAYHDPYRGENRDEMVQVTGTGAEALAGPYPAVFTNLGRVTALECASWRRTVGAANVGFVPICASGYRLEGAGCGRFHLVSEPDFSGDCISLERNEHVDFVFQYQPDDVGTDECQLFVATDAQNGDEVQVEIRGQGVESAETVNAFMIRRPNPNESLRFNLSRPAVAATIVVTVNNEANEDWEFDAESNVLFFARGNHPPRDSTLRVEYDAVCFERQ